MSLYKKYIAIDQYGNKIFLDKHPRKELLEHHGVQHAEKIYRDDENGDAVHVGYIIEGHWWEILKISPFKS